MAIGKSPPPAPSPGTGEVAGRVQGQFVPLSVFFLQLDGEEVDDGSEEDPKKPKKKRPGKLGDMNFDKDTANATTATQGAMPKPKQRKEEDTMSANAAPFPVPIGSGKPIRRTKRWIERLSKATEKK
jgi:hypothetical protein